MSRYTEGSGARIVGLGHYQPARIVTNDDLTTQFGVETNDAWIQDRVGIKARRFAADGETALDMSVAAAGKALANAGIEAGDVDLVIVATLSPPTMLPNVASQVAARLGINAPGAFDVNTACSGFSYGLATAQHAIVSGAAKTALVIGAEKLTDVIDFADRTTCILFADGAGAAVVTAAEQNGIGPVYWGSDGPRGDVLHIDDGGYIRQEGQAVFRWATTALAPFARLACERAGIDPTELVAFVPHQANVRIIDHIAKRLGATNAVIARDIVESGNTSSASIPLALSKLVERGELPSGGPALLFGFGGGLTYAGQVITIP
ncbi:beta-ketoacyl-ACP synthase III [Cryptosporangium arvum]|uniref:Beta-ketoacyl-[acyl-carrier-protein] synthase III n=1 Tax=Cryptosporangium arvum DSM 44712 TaxID=927661 RepID=A0A010ZQ49_9ACTN|nr:beta-ketoacyl-ACP synthase III [Cryptosporangium arvum]EXG80774.1 3-oxoacyl-(acyl-carrier-protein) synthase III [Cryptosporangium arvum DSM 44712]